MIQWLTNQIFQSLEYILVGFILALGDAFHQGFGIQPHKHKYI